jgi:hypothetical protein
VQFGQKIKYILYMSDISWIGKNRMELLHKIALLAIVAGVVGIITVPSVLADNEDDDDWKWGQKKQSDNQVALIQRSVPFELCGTQSLCDAQKSTRLQGSYACEEGEIILGGMVDSPLATSSLGSWDVDYVNQEFDVELSNRHPESIQGHVIYLCASMKS